MQLEKEIFKRNLGEVILNFIIEIEIVMWWIFAILAPIILIAIIIAIVLSHDRGDYKDGGGTQIGGGERIPFFITANERAGMWGEKVVNYHIRPLLREDEYLLANLLLPLQNGHKTEIDCVLITRKGIFCVETKNWVGHISGSDEDEYWIQRYDDPYKSDREHKNPIKQNEGHCSILERKLKNNYDVNNVVIFANLEDGRSINSNYAYTVRSFKNYYRDLSDLELNEMQIKAIYQMLLPYVATAEELKAHREEIKRRF